MYSLASEIALSLRKPESFVSQNLPSFLLLHSHICLTFWLPSILAAFYSCGLEKRVMHCYASQHEVDMSMIINQIFCFCILEHVCKEIADPIQYTNDIMPCFETLMWIERALMLGDIVYVCKFTRIASKFEIRATCRRRTDSNLI